MSPELVFQARTKDHTQDKRSRLNKRSRINGRIRLPARNSLNCWKEFVEVVSRREKIEAMLADEPEDTFLRYSLAMELCNEDQTDQALALLKALSKDTPPYVPAFFRSAQILADDGRVDQSRAFLRDGIEVAREQGDLHAAAEMSEMLSDLGHMGEEMT